MLQVVNLVTNRVSRILGKVENTERFLRVALYQGIPKQGIKTQRTLATTESTRNVTRQPTLLCTAYNKQRLFLFTTQEPNDSDQASSSRLDPIATCIPAVTEIRSFATHVTLPVLNSIQKCFVKGCQASVSTITAAAAVA